MPPSERGTEGDQLLTASLCARVLPKKPAVRMYEKQPGLGWVFKVWTLFQSSEAGRGPTSAPCGSNPAARAVLTASGPVPSGHCVPGFCLNPLTIHDTCYFFG